MRTFIVVFMLFSLIIVNAQTTRNVPSQYSTIHSAITTSQNGDTVLVQPGIYYERINYSGKNIVVASKYVLNRDTSFISQTIIDGNNVPSVVSFITKENQSAKLIGFTIQKGFYNGGDYRFNGGGIMIDGASPTINNCIIKDNYISWYGGGICIKNGSSAKLNSVKIFNNYSEHHGGGIAIIESAPTFTNLAVFNNSTGERGGGIFIASLVQPIIINCTIYGNTANGFSSHWGGGIALNNLDSKLIVLNSIIWNNTPNQIDNEFNQILPVFYSNIQNGYNGTGNINSNPMFVNASVSDFRLLNNSPSIGKGIDSLSHMSSVHKSPTTDFNNSLRPQPTKTQPDQGAFENILAIPVSIKIDEGQKLLIDFSLYQNYPNPFNPITTIKYSIPKSSLVTLKVYDMLGEEIQSLVNAEKLPGYYEAEFDGSKLSSGVYFYQIRAGSFVDTKKFVLIK